MNKQLLILALSLLMLAAIAPVMADPTDGQKVPVVQINGAAITTPTVCPRDGVTYPYTGTSNPNDGNITQRRDYGNVLGTNLIIDGGTPLVGISYNNYDRMWQYDRDTGLLAGSMGIYHYDAIWDYPTAGGGFEGNIFLLLTDYSAGPPVTYNAKMHALLQGYGAFEGQTLQFSYEGPNPVVWEGYLLKP